MRPRTHHFFDLSLGGGFRGIKNRALIGCMSHSAKNGIRWSERQRNSEQDNTNI